jgi:hypothetical protein
LGIGSGHERRGKRRSIDLPQAPVCACNGEACERNVLTASRKPGWSEPGVDGRNCDDAIVAGGIAERVAAVGPSRCGSSNF